jgi:hypothetical protein
VKSLIDGQMKQSIMRDKKLIVAVYPVKSSVDKAELLHYFTANLRWWATETMNKTPEPHSIIKLSQGIREGAKGHRANILFRTH